MPTSTMPDLLDDETRPDATPRPRPPARRIILWAAAVATAAWTVLLLGGVISSDTGNGIWLHVALNAWAVSWAATGVDWVSRANTVAAIRIVRADLDAHRQQTTAIAADVAALAAAVGEHGDARFLAGSQATIDALTRPRVGAEVLPINGRVPQPRNGFSASADRL